MKHLFFALRPKQWVKNLFIFLPLIFGQKLFCFPANMKTTVAFLLFSLGSGVVYIINDIIDYEGDKLHPIKKLRPLASGKISLAAARRTAVILGIFAIASSFALDTYLGIILLAYILFNYIYSKILKEIVIIDVFCLSGFFLLRIIAGTAVSKVAFSYWMIFMTVFLALFLGFGKRRQELELFKRKAVFQRRVLIKYSSYFIDQMIAVITSSIVVVYMLYTVDARTVGQFGNRHLIYSIPFVYYGIFRYLYLIHIRKKQGDPTRIMLSDRILQVNILLWIILCVGIIYMGV